MNTNIERLKKLQALALRGVGGEREQAQQILEKLAKKYGACLDDLNETKEEKFEFSYHGAIERKLLVQIAYKVKNALPDIYNLVYTKSGRKCRTAVKILCTEAEKIEIEFLFDFYKRLWEKEVNFLLNAYIQKHNLFGDLKEGEKPMEISPEDRKKIFAIMNGLSSETPLIQITDGN